MTIVWVSSAPTAKINATLSAVGVSWVNRATAITTANTYSKTFNARNTNRPMPSPTLSVTPGARNFSGASTNEIASTMPSHTKTAAIANLVPASTAAAYDRDAKIWGCMQDPVRNV